MSLRWWRFWPKTVMAVRLRCDGGITRKFRNVERNLHCDVVHITTKWVSSLTLDCNGVFVIKAYRNTPSYSRATRLPFKRVGTLTNGVRAGRSLSDAWGHTQRGCPLQTRAKMKAGASPAKFAMLQMVHCATYFVNEIGLHLVTLFCFLIPPTRCGSAGKGQLKRER